MIMKLRFIRIGLLAAMLTACGNSPTTTTTVPAPTRTTQIEIVPSISVPPTVAPATPAPAATGLATAVPVMTSAAAPTMDHGNMPMAPTAAAPGVKTPAQVVLALDYMRGHLLASKELVALGDFDAALIHANHPAGEHYFSIHTAIEAVDPELDQQATAALKAHAEAVQAKKDVATIGQAREAAQKLFDQIEAKLAPKIAQDTTTLVVTLLNTAATKYSEAIQDDKVIDTLAYQDAYGFSRQALVRLNANRAQVDPAKLGALESVVAMFTRAMAFVVPPVVVNFMPSVLQDAVSLLGDIDLIGDSTTAALKLGLEALISGPLEQVRTASRAGNREQIAQAFTSFENSWAIIKDSVRAQSPDAFGLIETAIADIKDAAVQTDVIDDATVQVNADALRKAIEDLTATLN